MEDIVGMLRSCFWCERKGILVCKVALESAVQTVVPKFFWSPSPLPRSGPKIDLPRQHVSHVWHYETPDVLAAHEHQLLLASLRLPQQRQEPHLPQSEMATKSVPSQRPWNLMPYIYRYRCRKRRPVIGSSSSSLINIRVHLLLYCHVTLRHCMVRLFIAIIESYTTVFPIFFILTVVWSS